MDRAPDREQRRGLGLLARFYLLTLVPMLVLAALMIQHRWQEYAGNLSRSIDRSRQATAVFIGSALHNDSLGDQLEQVRTDGTLPPAGILTSQLELFRQHLISLGLEIRYLALQDEQGALLASSGQSYRRAGSQDTSPPELLTLTLPGHARTLGQLQAEVYLPLQPLIEGEQSSLQHSFALFALVLAALLASTYLAGRSVVAPMEELARRARESRDGIIPDFPENRGPREVRTLAASLNQMARALPKVQGSLRRQLRFQQYLIDTVPVPIFVKDAQGRYLQCNEAFSLFVGKDRDTIVGSRVEELYAPEQAADFAKADDQMLAHGGTQSYQTRMTTADGKLRHVLLYKSVFSDEDGRPMGIIGASIDITDQILSDRALAQKEELLRNILEHIPAQVYWKNTELRYLGCNRQFAKLLGLSDTNSVIGLSMDRLPFGPDGIQRMAELDRKVLQTGRPVTGEHVEVVGEKSLRTLLVSKVPLTDPTDRVTGVLGINIDVTDRKQMENEIRASEERFRRLLGVSPVNICIVDRNGYLQFTNRIFHGLTLEQMVGHHFSELIDAIHVPHIQEAFDQVLREDSRIKFDFPFISQPSGEPRWWAVHIACLDRTPGEEAIALFGINITERKRAQEALQEAHDTLERHVEERTAELTDTLQRLKEENTIRRRAEEALRISESRFRNLYNHTPVMLLSVAANGSIVSANDYLLESLGYQRADLLGEHVQLLFADEASAAPLFQLQQDALPSSSRRTSRFIGHIRHHSGEMRQASVTAIAETGTATTPLVALVAMLDITEQLRVEDELRETQHQREALERIVNQSPAVAFLWRNTPGWPVEYVSANILQFGYRPEELLDGAVAFASLIHPDDRERVAGEVRVYSQDLWRAEFGQEYRLLTRDGQTRWIDDRTWVRRDDDGDITHYQGILLDITERKQAESELRRIRDDLSRLIETANTPIFAIDANGRINDWNLNASHLTEWPRDELVGQSLVDTLLVPEAQSMMEQSLRKALEGTEVSNVEATLRTRKGRQVDLAFNLTPRRNDRGRVTGVVGLGLDITARKMAERALQQARDRAEEASRAKSNFLATMSHEIRTPMNVIIGMTELSLQSARDAQQKEYLDAIKESTQHLLHLINDILDFSKIEANRLELEHTPFSLTQLIHTLTRPLGLRAWQKGLFLDVFIHPDVPEHLAGDPARLQQVLVNLTENALKFTDRFGICLRVAPATSDEAPPGAPQSSHQWLRFEVQDMGIGIASEHHETIFESFRQSDHSTTRTYGGTGLGLAICRELVQRMGGRIWVNSQLGGGSTFTFTVPLEVLPEAHAVPGSTVEDTDKPQTHQGTLLLAEDNPMNMKVARHFLSRQGYTLREATTGEEALAILREHKVDLVLMDIEMPQMDGLEATRQLRKGNAGSLNQNVPVIALTAHAFEGYREHCLAGGMDDFLTKPLDYGSLSRRIDRWLQQAKAEPAPTDGPVDQERALTKLDGDAALLEEISRMFLDGLPTTLEALEQTFNHGDWQQLKFQVHSLKSPAAMIGAERSWTLARQLESALASGDERLINLLFPRLQQELTQVQQHLSASLADTPSA